MKSLQLNAQLREASEKPKVLRRLKVIPAVVYGHNHEPISIKIENSEFIKVYRVAGENHIIQLIINEKKINVLVHDFQKNPITDEFNHVDFTVVITGEKVHTHVPLSFVWDSKAKQAGAMIEEHLKEVEVKCLPSDLVDNIEVDLSLLVEIGDNIKISDMKVNPKIEILNSADDVVVSANKIKAVVEETPTEAAEESTEK